MRLRVWIDERLPLDDVLETLRHKRVPHHRYSVWYYFGGMTLFLFLIQVGTGALLLLYYRPSAAEAYESVQFIVSRVPFGWLVRSIHAWAANLMVASAFAHLFSVLFLHAYRRPRELTWISGLLLLLLTLAFGFTGYLLPWNTVSFFATRVGTDIAASVPVVGEGLVRFLRGGDDVTGATLTRLFGFHVAVLPGVATSLVALHLLLVQRHGMSIPPSIERRAADAGGIQSIPFLPHFLLRDLFAWTAVLAVLASLATFVPWELGAKADPFQPAPAGIRPEWYFLWAFETLKHVPPTVAGVNGELVAVALMGAVVLGAILLPLLVGASPRARAAVVWAGAGFLLFMSVMTGLALRAVTP
ncbi:MAG: cytochrome bc complex cytochrome b subunit [Acidobacteria bacterium RIFCSPLOWO2_02_FULL_68_18]|nr:MAG: cytochrome bc complex cytochrome b subunit [Acidobacteria bacterium RIFCSPLOWO2_02_FULL_68_18]OFW48735.1 MAG: cytochrome bc complex cytochrome b subunit [Acidobacteria bacterium RIFCSPLOWO2_12_FULL_68_19]